MYGLINIGCTLGDKDNGVFRDSHTLSSAAGTTGTGSGWVQLIFDSSNSVRTSNVTREKSKGVKYIIKVL